MSHLLRITVSAVLFLTSLWIFSSAFAGGKLIQPLAEASPVNSVLAVQSTGPAEIGERSEMEPIAETGVLQSTDTKLRNRNSGQGVRLVASFTVFLLAVFVGFEVITKVPPTLHTPLMSGSNAISGITIVGALLTAGHAKGGFGAFLGMIALLLAFINVMGGFLVTHRMLMMFKKR